jgi:hypothetical protein
MSDVPEVDGGDDDERRSPRSDASEADAQEQAADVRRVGRARKERSAEVPEADAYEQSQEVPDDEDDID